MILAWDDAGVFGEKDSYGGKGTSMKVVRAEGRGRGGGEGKGEEGQVC